MQWEMAHRPRGTYEITAASLEAGSSWEAVEALRAQIPEGDLVLFVRSAE